MNCKNCGAPIDLSQSKCPYCETPYVEKKSIKDFRSRYVMDCSGLYMANIANRHDILMTEKGIYKFLKKRRGI